MSAPPPARPLNGSDNLSGALRACRRHFVAVAGFSALANLLFITPTLYMLHVYDEVLATGGQMTLLLISLIAAAALVVQGFLDWMRSRLLVRAGVRLDEQLAGSTIALVLKDPSNSRGQLLRDFDTLRQTLGGSALLSLFDLPWAPFYLLLTFVLHPLIGLLALVGGAVIFTLALINERRTRERTKAAGEASTLSYATLAAAAGSADTVRALGMVDALMTKHLGERETMTAHQSKAAFTGAFYTSVIKALRIILQSAALGLGAWLVLHNQMSGGAMIAASFLLSRALAPIEQITGAWPTLDRARNAFASLRAAHETAPETSTPTRLPRPSGLITIENVSAMTPDGSRHAVRNVTLRLDAGMIIGVTGESGSGKSTLGRLLVGAKRPDDGAVRFDGASIEDWDPAALARHIGYMPQDFALFEGTIKENISRFRGYLGEDAARLDAMAIEAAKAAAAHEMILRLPNGYETRLAAGGGGLSGGQAQRIALARALFGSPSILVLDEPNAHLDGESERILLHTLAERRRQGVTVVVLSHSRPVLTLADGLVVLRNGEVDAAGPIREVADELRRRQQARETAAHASAATWQAARAPASGPDAGVHVRASASA